MIAKKELDESSPYSFVSIRRKADKNYADSPAIEASDEKYCKQ